MSRLACGVYVTYTLVKMPWMQTLASQQPDTLDTYEWWSQAGSNRRPPACKAGALPAELWPLWTQIVYAILHDMVGLGGFEPPTSPLSGVRSNQLSYRPEVFNNEPCNL